MDKRSFTGIGAMVTSIRVKQDARVKIKQIISTDKFIRNALQNINVHLIKRRR